MQASVQSLQCGIYLVVIGIEQVEGTLWYYLTPQHLFTYYSHGIDIYTSDPKFPPFQDSSQCTFVYTRPDRLVRLLVS
jgi:hypothetical protein